MTDEGRDDADGQPLFCLLFTMWALHAKAFLARCRVPKELQSNVSLAVAKCIQNERPTNSIRYAGKAMNILEEVLVPKSFDDLISRGEKKEEEGEDVILKYYLSNDLRTLKSIFIDSPDDTTTIQIDYLTRDSINRYLVPNDVQMVIVTPRNRLVITLDYERTEVNVPQEIRFVIPEEYGECTGKEGEEAQKPEEEEPE